MLFAKKQEKCRWLACSVFALSYGFLVSFFTMIFGEKLGYFSVGVPNNVLGLSFLAGVVLGFLLEKGWSKMEGLNKALLTSLVLFLFTAFMSILGVVVGATLGGNGMVYFDWAGLEGYESTGLVFGCVSSVLGFWVAYRALMPTTKKTAWVLLSSGVLMLALLLLGDQLQNPNLSSMAVLGMPVLGLVLHYGFKF